MGRLSTIVAAVAVTVGLGVTGGRALADRPLKPLQSWKGLVADPDLRDLAPESGVITQAADFERLWKAWGSPGEPVPEVNFGRDLVLVGTAPGPNRVLLAATLERDGNIKLVPAATKIGGGGFGFTLMTVLRHGVTSVNGRPLSADALPEVGQPGESVRVQIHGRLHTGRAAIGGETTGTSVTADGITWEVSLGGSEQLAARAEELAGHPVVIDGVLERQEAAAAPARWIVHARTLDPAR
jgi:hypothetical protein